MIPLSKLRNASIGIHNQPPKKHCMLVCYKFCMFATHNKSFKEICKTPFLESLSLQLGMSSGTWVRSHAGEQSQYGSYQLPVLHNSLLYDPNPPSTSRYQQYQEPFQLYCQRFQANRTPQSWSFAFVYWCSMSLHHSDQTSQGSGCFTNSLCLCLLVNGHWSGHVSSSL